MKSLVIAIDLDDTYTAAPELFDAFVSKAKFLGHRVICVTARHDNDENREIANDIRIPVYFTGRQAKQFYMETVWNMKVDIWIDDNPAAILNGV